MFTDHQIDLFAEALHISPEQARRQLDARLAIEIEQAHTEALDHNDALVTLSQTLTASRENAERIDRERNATAQRTEIIARDHAAALLDNLPCELCGHIEMHPKHRGIGHTHTPAEDPRGRAHALLRQIASDPSMVVPDYVYESARMMIGPNLVTLIESDHDAALREYRAVTEVTAYLTEMGDDVLTRPASPFTNTRDLGHPAEPHSRQPGVCRICRRPIHVRTDDQGGFVSAAHHA